MKLELKFIPFKFNKTSVALFVGKMCVGWYAWDGRRTKEKDNRHHFELIILVPVKPYSAKTEDSKVRQQVYEIQARGEDLYGEEAEACCRKMAREKIDGWFKVLQS